MSDRESTSRAVIIVSTCYEHLPWLINYYATPKTLIIQNYVLSDHPTIQVVIPSEEEIRQSVFDLGFSSSWISECNVLTGDLIVSSQPQKSTFPLLTIQVLLSRVRSSTVFRVFISVINILTLQSLSNNTLPMRKIAFELTLWMQL